MVKTRRSGSAFTEQQPPPADAPGLWFGLVDLDNDGDQTRDMYLDAEQLDEYPADHVIGGSWTPRDNRAHSEVLDRIYKICRQDERSSLADAETILSLTYAALAIRALATTIDPGVLLGKAIQRVLAVGYSGGDSIGVGTLRHDGLKFPRR